MSLPLHRRFLLWAITPALAVGAVSTPEAGAAEPETLKLAWRDSSGECPRGAIDSLFLDHLHGATRPTKLVHATAELSRSDSGLQVRLTARVGGHVGRRDFAARDCQEAQAAIALLLALVAESRALPAETPAQPPPPPATVPEPPVDRPAREPEPPRTVEAAPAQPAAVVAWGVELQTLGSFGVVPEPGLGLGLRVGARWQSVEVSLRATAQSGSVSRRIEFQPTANGETELTTTVRRAELGVGVCHYFFPIAAPLSVGACLHSGLHQTQAHFEPEGAGESTSSAQWHGSASARALLRWGPLLLSGEPFVGLETVQPVRGVCPIGATPSEVCDQDQYVGNSINFGLRAGIGTQF